MDMMTRYTELLAAGRYGEPSRLLQRMAAAGKRGDYALLGRLSTEAAGDPALAAALVTLLVLIGVGQSTRLAKSEWAQRRRRAAMS
jgi:hypothetical protein